MDIDAFAKRESMLKLREYLVSVEEERLNGKYGYSVDETVLKMQEAIQRSISRRSFDSVADSGAGV